MEDFYRWLHAVTLCVAVRFVPRWPSAVTAEVITQEALRQFVRRWNQGYCSHFVPGASDQDAQRVMSAFCRRVAYELLRAEQRNGGGTGGAIEFGDLPAPPPPPQEDTADLTELVRAELTEQERAVFDLMRSGMPPMQVAEHLDINREAVYTRQYRINYRMAVLALERVTGSRATTAEEKGYAQGVLNRLYALSGHCLTENGLYLLETQEAESLDIPPRTFRSCLAQARKAAFRPTTPRPQIDPPPEDEEDDDGDVPFVCPPT